MSNQFGQPPYGQPYGQPLGVPGQVSSGVPHAGPVPGNHGQLYPHNHQRAIAAGVPWTVTQIVPPGLQQLEGYRYQLVMRSAVFSTVAAMTSPSTDQFRQFNPGAIYAMTGDGYKTDGTDLPVGRNALQCFKVRLYFTSGTTTSLNVTTAGANPVLASTILSPASLPSYMPLNGIRVDQGWQLSVDCQILVANFEAVITIWSLDEYPPGA